MAGPSGRPVPPGRPRASQARAASSGSARQPGTTPTMSPSMSSSKDTEVESGMASTTEQEELKGLGLESSQSPPSFEIPLEEVEDALRGLSRDELVLALKRAKEQMDILDAKVESSQERNEMLTSTLSDYATQLDALEADKSGLQFALAHREERIDELLREQERMEEDVYRKGQVNERLRKQLDESERGRAEAERRYEEQTASSDKERQYYVDTEKLLQSQKSKASTALERAQTANHELIRQNERLQSQIVQQSKYPTLRIASPSGRKLSGGNVGKEDSEEADGNGVLGSSASEGTIRNVEGVGADTSEVASLQSDFDTLQASHSSLSATMQQLQAELRDLKAANVELRNQNETFVDLLQEKTINGELVTESAMLNRRYSTGNRNSETSSDAGETTTTDADDDEDEDDVPDVPARKARGKTGRSARHRSDSHEQMADGAPHDLASELQTSEPVETRVREARRRERTRGRSEALSTNVDDLHREIWELREANQALTLYVNKILDRIIAREGYENVLAVDADQKRTLRGKSSAYIRAASAATSPTVPTSAQPAVPSSPPSTQALKSPTTPVANPSVAALQNSKVARRTTSIDWRSFLPSVGGSSAAGGLTVQQPSSTDKAVGEARKIRSSEEVEDKQDEEAREQIRQNLLRQGIVLPDNQLKSQRRTSTLGTFFSRVMGGGGGVTVPSADPSTPSKSLSSSHRYQSQSDISIDGATTPSTSHVQTSSENGSSTTSEGSGSPMSRREMRQRALDAGSNGPSNLTEPPQRRSLVEDFRARRAESVGTADSRSIASRTSADPSSSPSVSPSMGVLAPMPEEDVEQQG